MKQLNVRIPAPLLAAIEQARQLAGYQAGQAPPTLQAWVTAALVNALQPASNEQLTPASE